MWKVNAYIVRPMEFAINWGQGKFNSVWHIDRSSQILLQLFYYTYALGCYLST